MSDIKKRSGVSMMTMAGKSQSKSIAAFNSKSMSRMKMRRSSYGFSRIPGVRNAEASQLAMDFKRPILMYLNTYQLEPHVKFDPIQVAEVAEELLDECFTKYKYDAQESPELALDLASVLMKQVKAMNYNRYRIISVVTIGQKRAQSYVNAVAFVWDHLRDGYMNIQREVHTAFIQITVFAIYLD